MLLRLLKQNKLSFIYGASLAALLFLMKWLELKLLILDHSLEIYIGAIAIIFTLLGIWLAKKISVPRKIEPEPASTVSPLVAGFDLNQSAIDALGISKRELEVLQGMSEGLSNQELADRLFVSLNTIKTHNSRLFEKLDVKRRTQAIEKAKRLQLIP
jgi:two-component system, NarL family, response regulator LiaR